MDVVPSRSVGTSTLLKARQGEKWSYVDGRGHVPRATSAPEPKLCLPVEKEWFGDLSIGFNIDINMEPY